MLEALLQEIRSGGALEAHHLAVRLGTSPQIVQAMLEHLERAGYIQNYTSCSGGCSGCGLSDTCAPQGRTVRLWHSRAKG